MKQKKDRIISFKNRVMIMINTPFTRFLVIGLLNTLVYYSVYLLLNLFLPYLASHILGFLVAFIFSFFMNCYVVYKVKPTWGKLFKFPLTQVFNMGMQTLLLYFLVEYFTVDSKIAPLPALIITVPFTYIITKWILTDKYK